MKYKVGDKARVKTDLIPHEEYGAYSFIRGMVSYQGKAITIGEVDNNCECYTAEDNNNSWCWTDEMLEPIGTET